MEDHSHLERIENHDINMGLLYCGQCNCYHRGNISWDRADHDEAKKKVINFFIEHPVHTFITFEIHDYIDIQHERYGQIMKELVDEGLIEKDGMYGFKLKDLDLCTKRIQELD